MSFLRRSTCIWEKWRKRARGMFTTNRTSTLPKGTQSLLKMSKSQIDKFKEISLRFAIINLSVQTSEWGLDSMPSLRRPVETQHQGLTWVLRATRWSACSIAVDVNVRSLGTAAVLSSMPRHASLASSKHLIPKVRLSGFAQPHSCMWGEWQSCGKGFLDVLLSSAHREGRLLTGLLYVPSCRDREILLRKLLPCKVLGGHGWLTVSIPSS